MHNIESYGKSLSHYFSAENYLNYSGVHVWSLQTKKQTGWTYKVGKFRLSRNSFTKINEYSIVSHTHEFLILYGGWWQLSELCALFCALGVNIYHLLLCSHLGVCQKKYRLLNLLCSVCRIWVRSQMCLRAHGPYRVYGNHWNRVEPTLCHSKL